MTNSTLQYKFHKEITTKGIWLTDEPISFFINEFRKEANEKVYIAGTFTTGIIRNNTKNNWTELARLFHNKRALDKEDGIYIIPSFVGIHTAGHWLTNIVHLKNRSAKGFILDSLNNEKCEENIMIQKRIQEFFSPCEWSGWSMIPCRGQTEVECGPRMLWNIRSISIERGDVFNNFDYLIQTSANLFNIKHHNKAFGVRNELGNLLNSYFLKSNIDVNNKENINPLLLDTSLPSSQVKSNITGKKPFILEERNSNSISRLKVSDMETENITEEKTHHSSDMEIESITIESSVMELECITIEDSEMELKSIIMEDIEHCSFYNDPTNISKIINMDRLNESCTKDQDVIDLDISNKIQTTISIDSKKSFNANNENMVRNFFEGIEGKNWKDQMSNEASENKIDHSFLIESTLT